MMTTSYPLDRALLYSVAIELALSPSRLVISLVERPISLSATTWRSRKLNLSTPRISIFTGPHLASLSTHEPTGYISLTSPTVTRFYDKTTTYLLQIFRFPFFPAQKVVATSSTGKAPSEGTSSTGSRRTLFADGLSRLWLVRGQMISTCRCVETLAASWLASLGLWFGVAWQ